MSRIITVLVAGLVLTSVAPAPGPTSQPQPAKEPRPLEQCIPADAVEVWFRNGWPDHKDAFAKTALAEMLKHPSLRKLGESIGQYVALGALNGHAQLLQMADTHEVVKKMLALGKESLAIGLSRPGCFFAVPVPGPKPGLERADVVQLGPEAARHHRALMQRLEAIIREMGGVLEDATVGGFPYRVVRHPELDDSACYGYVGNVAIECTSADVYRRVAETVAGRAASIQKKPWYRRLRAQLGEPNPLVLGVADVRADYSGVGREVVLHHFTRGLAGKGKLPFRGVGLSIALKDRGFRTRLFFDAPAPREGAMRWFDGKPLERADLSLVPPDSAAFYLMRAQPAAMLKALGRFCLAVLPNEMYRFSRSRRLKEFAWVFDLRPVAEAMKTCLGDRMAVCVPPGPGLKWGPPFPLLVFEVKNRRRLERAWQRIADQIPGRLAVGSDERRRVFKESFHGMTMWSRRRIMMDDINPTVAVGDRVMIVGASNRTVSWAVQRLSSLPDRYAGPPAFARLWKDRGKPGVGVAYLDIEKLAVLFDASDYSVRLLPRNLGLSTQPAEGHKPSPLDPAVWRPLFPEIASVGAGKEGIRIEAAGPLPVTFAAYAAWLGLTSIMCASELPNLVGDRERALCLTHGQRLGHAVRRFERAEEEKQKRAFPTATIANPKLPRKKQLSLFVNLLWYMGRDDLHEAVDWEKAWDDPANAFALRRTLDGLLCPAALERENKDGYGYTHYVGIAGVGPGALKLPRDHPRAGVISDKHPTRRKDIRDGLAQTAVFGEVVGGIGPWAAGGTGTVRSLDPKQPAIHNGPLREAKPVNFGCHSEGGIAHFTFADGSVRLVSGHADPAVLRALMTINGGEQIGDEDF